MHIHGTVDYWLLTTKRRDGTITEERFHSWESVTEAFHETKAANPFSAVVEAIHRRGRGHPIKTWHHESTND